MQGKSLGAGSGFDPRGGQGLGQGLGSGLGQGLGSGLGGGGGEGDDGASMSSDRGRNSNSSIFSLHTYWDDEKARLHALNQSQEALAKQQLHQEQQQVERAKKLKIWQV